MSPAGDAYVSVEASDTPAPAPDRLSDPGRPVAPTASPVPTTTPPDAAPPASHDADPAPTGAASSPTPTTLPAPAPAPTDATIADSHAASADAEAAAAEITAPSADAPPATADAPVGRGPGAPVPAAVSRPAASGGVDGEDERPIPGLALIGVVLGLWAMAPAYTGPGLILQDPSVELIDHVLPGVGVIGVSVAAIVVTRSSPRPGAVLFAAGAAVTTAGLWMVATHVPLLLQAVQGEAPWGAVLYHLAPSAAVLWLGLAWTVRYWTDWIAPPG